jgi:glutamine amidotransferase
LIAILDYGSGNVLSAARAFETTGESVVITRDAKSALNAKALVIPGVGAFGACVAQLLSIGGNEIIQARVEKELPIFGICVGMQILFESGIEKGNHLGLGIFSGTVKQLNAPVLPHIGWNQIESSKNNPLFSGIENERFYFVHSYAVKSNQDSNAIISKCNYGEEFISSISKDNISATQFHPEKSGSAGLKLISNWSKTI